MVFSRKSRLFSGAGNRALSALLVLLFILAPACSSGGVGIRELKKFCELDAGFFVYKTAEAAGYYNATEMTSLVHTNFLFAEYCDDSVSPYEPIPDPGCYRLTKVDRQSGQCHAGLDRRLSTFVVEPYPEFLAEKCIAVEKIEHPTARYSFHGELKNWYSKNGVSKFRRAEYYVMDESDSVVMARYVGYSLFLNPGLSPSISCHHVSDRYPSYVETNLIESVIKPMQ